MKPWMRTALAVVLVLAIAAGGFFLPNFVSARLDRSFNLDLKETGQ